MATFRHCPPNTFRFAPIVAALVTLLGATIHVQNLHADTRFVSVTADDGLPDTLRGALAAANHGDVIDATGVSGTIFLEQGELVVDKSVAILAAGPGSLTVDADHRSGAFRISPGLTVTIDGFSIVNGNANSGGGISSDVSDLTVANCILRDNTAAFGGGGISNFGGTVTVTNCRLIGNSTGFEGGAIFNTTGTVVASNCTLNENSAGSNGGGIFNVSGTIIVTGSTLSSNSAGDWGGGISSMFEASTALIANCTLSRNHASMSGGGIDNFIGSATVINCTLVENSAGEPAGGNVHNNSGFFEIGSTILKAVSPNGNFNNIGTGTIASRGFNLSSDDGGGFLTATGDQIDTDPMLAPLADNGGRTFTHALLPESPAIDRGNRAVIPFLASDFDQRGFPRPAPGSVPLVAGGDGSDIGAFEAQSGLSENGAPTASDDAYVVNVDVALVVQPPGVLGNDLDPDAGDVLTTVLLNPPANSFGFALNPDGSFTYLANAGFTGQDSFTYRAYDGQANSNVATVTITVNPGGQTNHPPTAVDDVYEAIANTQLSVHAPGLLTNDFDLDADALTAVLVSWPAQSLFFHMGSDGSFDYVAKPGFIGVDRFTYQASDGQGLSLVATVTIVVSPPNEADLHVGLAVDNLNPRQGDLLTYTITVRNFGGGTARNAVVNDILSSGTTFHSANANRGRFTAPQSGQTGTVTWYLGDLLNEGQESAQIKVTVIVKGRTTITNSASAMSDTPDPNPANNTASITTSVAQGGGGGGNGKNK